MTDRFRPSLLPTEFFHQIALLLAIMIAALILMIADGASRELATRQADPHPTDGPAVCTTDADCAQWEIDHNVPTQYRVYGAPAPAQEVR